MKLFCKAFVIALCLAGCARVYEDVTNDPKVSHEVGKVYRTEKELLLFSFRDKPKVLIISDFGHGSDVPTRDIVGTQFPKKYYSIILKGIAPAGTEFKVEKIVLQGSTGLSVLMYYARITKCVDSAWQGKEIIVSDLMKTLNLPYVFNEELVSVVTPQSSPPLQNDPH